MTMGRVMFFMTSAIIGHSQTLTKWISRDAAKRAAGLRGAKQSHTCVSTLQQKVLDIANWRRSVGGAAERFDSQDPMFNHIEAGRTIFGCAAGGGAVAGAIRF